MDKKRYDELVELYERLEAAEKLFGLRYGDLKKVDGKFYWKRLIDVCWIRDKYRRTISREVPCHWNWSEIEPIDCARLFAQGDLPFCYLSSGNNDYDTVGRDVFGDEVWNEASRLFDEYEDGVNYIEWRDLEESTSLIFPEPAPIPSVEDLDDWKSVWFLPNEDDFVAYLKGEKKLNDFQTLVYCPMYGAVGLKSEFEPVVWRTFPILKGREWKFYVDGVIDSLIQEVGNDEEDSVIDGLEAINFENWTAEQKEKVLERYYKSDYELFVYECDDGHNADIMYNYIKNAVNNATSERYW